MSDEPNPSVPSHQPESGVDETPGKPAASAPDAATAGSAGQGAPAGPGGSAGVARAAGAGAPAVKRDRRRVVRIVLAVVLGAATLLCIGGLGVGYLFYRQVSEPDRTTPAVVVRQYLQATFDDRDKMKVARFTCGRPEEIAAMEQTVADIVSREQRFDIHITVGWENVTAQENKQTATVSARLAIQVPEQSGQPSESFQNWSFALRRQSGGWRVCGAQRTG